MQQRLLLSMNKAELRGDNSLSTSMLHDCPRGVWPLASNTHPQKQGKNEDDPHGNRESSFKNGLKRGRVTAP